MTGTTIPGILLIALGAAGIFKSVHDCKDNNDEMDQRTNVAVAAIGGTFLTLGLTFIFF